MAGVGGRNTLDTALGSLNEDFKFFLAHLPFSARPPDIREYFSKFGTVNFVKLVFDKSGKSKGYGFLYMNDRVGDAAVEDYARSNNNRITLLNKSGVFLNRNDRKRQNPIRNPTKRYQDDRPPAGRDSYRPPNYESSRQFSHPSNEYRSVEPGWNHAPPAASMGAAPHSAPVNHYSQEPSLPPQSRDYSYPYDQYAPSAQHVPLAPHVQNSPQMVYGNGSMNVRPSPPPPVQSFRPTTKVFLENLPLTSTPDDICNTLFHYSLHVIQCTMEYDNDPKASWCYAHIEYATPEEASRCIALAQQSLLEYRGRVLTASEDPHFQLPAPVPVSHAAPPPSNYAAPVPQYSEYGPAHSNQSPRSNYSMNPRNAETRGHHPGRGRGHNRNRSNRRHRPY